MKIRWFVVIVGFLLVSSCATDPSAVTAFSAMAPDADKLHTLTVAYATAPNQLIEFDVMNRLTSENVEQLTNQVTKRNLQVTAIDSLNMVLVNYMQALGVLANNGLVQTSPDTKDVTDGLTALTKAVPELQTDLTTNMITSVQSFTEGLNNP
jgi:hypothetical protein